MRIDELDELQGVTPQLVTDWLLANGWQRMPAQDMPRSECWVRKGGAGGTIWIGVESSAEKTLSKLAVWMECSVQALLREINPRMRKGWPSEAAVQTHARWLAKSGPTGHIICGMMEIDPAFGPCLKSRTARLDKVRADDWFFWPCDANGNKTRWPVDTEGNML